MGSQMGLKEGRSWRAAPTSGDCPPAVPPPPAAPSERTHGLQGTCTATSPPSSHSGQDIEMDLHDESAAAAGSGGDARMQARACGRMWCGVLISQRRRGGAAGAAADTTTARWQRQKRQQPTSAAGGCMSQPQPSCNLPAWPVRGFLHMMHLCLQTRLLFRMGGCQKRAAIAHRLRMTAGT